MDIRVLAASAWARLYMLFMAGHFVWFAFGILIPVIPCVYSLIVALQHFGVI